MWKQPPFCVIQLLSIRVNIVCQVWLMSERFNCLSSQFFQHRKRIYRKYYLRIFQRHGIKDSSHLCTLANYLFLLLILFFPPCKHFLAITHNFFLGKAHRIVFCIYYLRSCLAKNSLQFGAAHDVKLWNERQKSFAFLKVKANIPSSNSE